jgi:hypothetical protein
MQQTDCLQTPQRSRDKMSSKDGAGSKSKDQKGVAPTEEEYVIEQTLAHYIDRKDLAKLLARKFGKEIAVYVSKVLPAAGGTYGHCLPLSPL